MPRGGGGARRCERARLHLSKLSPATQQIQQQEKMLNFKRVQTATGAAIATGLPISRRQRKSYDRHEGGKGKPAVHVKGLLIGLNLI
jgi:hypothetical protein